MDVSPESASAVVLAGGLSRRMGQDKRRLQLHGADGPLLLEHTVAVMASVCDEVVVVLNDPDAWRHVPAKLVSDVYVDGGALGGIYAGLAVVQHEFALTVACDMPFLNPALLRAMLARSRDYDVLLPRSLQPGTARNALDVEPLHAIYRTTCLGPIRAALDANRRKIAAFFPKVHVAYVEPDEIARYDPEGRSFMNVNTPEERARVTR